jgi:polyhydroxybutyrate depolymerase
MRCFVLVVLVACSGSGPPGDDDDDTPDAGNVPITGTAGCNVQSSIATSEFVAQPLTIAGNPREYFIRLPAGYDREHPYPIVYQQHGCSSAPARQDNNVPLEGESGTDAILVRGRAAANCWDTSASGTDVVYWDAMVAEIDERFCVDPTRRFATGYSSGSFMTHHLGCIRGDLLRGVATIAGGQRGSGCTGDPAALLIHDANDNTVDISASEQTRDGYLARNGCDATSTPTDQPPCAAYSGCTAGKPVVWCMTTGQDHSRQDGLAAPIFWTFLSGL